MANICTVKFRKSISSVTIKNTLNSINKEYFKDTLDFIFYEEEGEFQGWSIKIKEDNSSMHLTIWVTNACKTYEWKHHHDQLMWWIAMSVMSRFILSINPRARISDEGIDTKLQPNFHIIYPLPSDWILAIPISLKMNKIIIKIRRNILKKQYIKIFPNFWKAVN